jgi:hypothetical protein
MGKEHFDSYFAASISGASWCTDTMIIKRKVLEEAGLFRIGQKRANDLDMWWRIAHRQPQIGYSPQPLAVYHMGTPQTISQGFFRKELYCDLIERHLKLAAEHNRLEKFQPFAAFMLRRWMRSMLFQARREDIRTMIKRFEKLLPGSYRILMYLLTTCPRITANGCHLLSWINQILKLRPKTVRRPKR